MIKHFLALVIATFNLCELLMNPTPFVRVVEIITISFSCPWYESIVFTVIGNGPSELKTNKIFGKKFIQKNSLKSKSYKIFDSISDFCFLYGVITAKLYCSGFGILLNSSLIMHTTKSASFILE